jgi:hypothetical protein
MVAYGVGFLQKKKKTLLLRMKIVSKRGTVGSNNWFKGLVKKPPSADNDCSPQALFEINYARAL